jgi:HAD superfamily hydrolase (TIGR01509 family)
MPSTLAFLPSKDHPCVRGMIFDFDGTIADSIDVWYWVDQEFLARRELVPPSDYGKKLSTLGFDRAARFVIDEFDLDESPESIMHEWNDLALERYATTVYLKPHARAYLEQIRLLEGVKIAVATTLDPPLLLAALENNNALDLFDIFAHGYEVPSDKREPDIYLLAAKRLEILPVDCVVFEDILPGILSAKRAGMMAVGVRDDSGHQEIEKMRAHADAFIDTFEELPL